VFGRMAAISAIGIPTAVPKYHPSMSVLVPRLPMYDSVYPFPLKVNSTGGKTLAQEHRPASACSGI